MKYSGIHMSRTDLIELYQLLSMYQRVYQEEEKKAPEEILEDIRGIYRDLSYGDEIMDAKNPRKAGRRKIYTEEDNKKIKEIYNSCKSMRKTAKEAGCSLGHVQDVVRPKPAERPWMYGN